MARCSQVAKRYLEIAVSVLAYSSAACRGLDAAQASDGALPHGSDAQRYEPASLSQQNAGHLTSSERPRAGLGKLDVPGFGAALFYSPAADSSRSLVVAAHGAGGSPEWECEYWRRLTRERAFLVCLRGTAMGTYDGYYYKDHLALEREFVAAERAARAADPRIAASSGVYAGFSQGSSMGTAMVASHGQGFPFLVLIEGFELWNVPRARAFARAGGKRVLIACGSKECAKVGRDSVHWLEVAGLQARLEFEAGAGHTPADGVMVRVEAALPWLFGDDPLWRE